MKTTNKSEWRNGLPWFIILFTAVILWSIGIVVVFIYFGYLIKDFLENIRDISFRFSISGIEFSVKAYSRTDVSHLTESAINQKTVDRQRHKRHKLKSLKGAHILWVDDTPTNNEGERADFEQQGVRFTISTSTEDALTKVHSNNYDAIISDMGRPPDKRAGYTLLSALQEMDINIPFVIYSGANLPEHKAEACSRGAVGSTNDFSELYQLVVDAVVDV